jgi:hypothetical protein
MSQKDQKDNKRVPFEFVTDILKWLLEINFLKYGVKKPSL